MGLRGKAALGGAVMLGVVGAIFAAFFLAGQGLDRAAVWATVLGLPVGVASAIAGVVAAVVAVRPSRALIPADVGRPVGAVSRPLEEGRVVAALLSGGTVGITTGLLGAGGFGKTTLAQMVCADKRVQRRFSGGVLWVTVGRDVRGGAAVAAKVSEVIRGLGEDATFTDPDLAGSRLGALLNSGPRKLLVIDDVWDNDQLTPFVISGRRCARLVTTRVPWLLDGRGAAVHVDQMSDGEARQLLTTDLPPLDPVVAAGLLSATGRWPLLLRLVNKILANSARSGGNADAAGTMLLERLHAGGPQAVDDLLGHDGRSLNVSESKQRAQAVRATIEASASLLTPMEADRFDELGVFAEDELIPVDLIALLWRATAGVDELQARLLCARLRELALVSISLSAGHDGVEVHDVIRDYIRSESTPDQLAGLNETLLHVVAGRLPAGSPPDTKGHRQTRAAWWKLKINERYLLDHLIWHLLAGGHRDEAEALANDLRWVGTRVQQAGPAAAVADLALVDTFGTARLRSVLARTAHLLAPTQPSTAVVDILHSRVAEDPLWGAQVKFLQDSYPRPRIVNRSPLPDLPNPALRRVLRVHHGEARTIAVAPNGTWLATGSSDGTVQIWDADTGLLRASLTGHRGEVTGVAIAPDGGWLATASCDGTARIWDTATGKMRVTLAGHRDWVTAVAIAPDSRWLATASNDSTVRTWDPDTGQSHVAHTGGYELTTAPTIALDGSWLVTNSHNSTVRIWDAITGQERAVFALSGHDGWVSSVAVASDGTWLVTHSGDGTARLWDVSTKQERATLTGHRAGEWVRAAVMAPDGSWLVTGGRDQTVRIWDTATKTELAATNARKRSINAIAVGPHGSRFVTGSRDGTIRIWDATTGREYTAFTNQSAIAAVTFSPDGSWMASGGDDTTMLIWDVSSGQIRASLTSEIGWVRAIAIAPNGHLLVTCSTDGVLHIWDIVAKREITHLKDYKGDLLTALLIAPDGSWIAAGSRDGIIRIWNSITFELEMSITAHNDQINAMAVASDGTWLVTSSYDRTIRIWETTTGQQQVTLADHQGSVTDIAVAPSGRWLAATSAEGNILIWDTTAWKVRAAMRVENEIYACAWLDNKGIAVVGLSGLYLFDFLEAN
jgi:WD40 repeat protein